MLPNYRFEKKERLTGKTLIEKLYTQPGGSLFIHPVKFTWMPMPYPGDVPAQVLITVSKKNFRKAHDRNRIKRQLREVYRKNKSILYDFLTLNDQRACFLISYVGKEHTETPALENKVTAIFKKFINAAQPNT